jgi:hypothetical protein
LRVPIGVIKEGERNPEHWIALTGGAGRQFSRAVDTDSQLSSYYAGFDATDRPIILKYNNLGVSQFKKRLQSTNLNQEFGNSVKTDSSNSFAISAFGGDNSGFLGYVSKYSSTGAYQWQRVFRGVFANLIDSDSSNNLYISASFSPRAYLVKLNSSGAIQWQRGLGFNPDPDTNMAFADVSLDSSGNVIAAGARNIVNVSQSGIIAKYDSSGNLLWQRGVSATTSLSFTKVVTDANNNIYALANRTRLDIGFSLHPVLIKFDSSGNIQWQRSFSTEIYSPATDLAIDQESNLYVSQEFSTAPAAGGSVISKVSSAGQIEWQRRIFEQGTNRPSSPGLKVSGQNLYICLDRGSSLSLNPDAELLSMSIPINRNNYGSYKIASITIVIEPVQVEFVASSFSVATSSFASGADSASSFTTSSQSITDLTFQDFKTNI